MSACALDTNILIWSRKTPSTKHEKEISRCVKLLFHQIAEEKISVVIPTLVLAEYLAGSPQHKHGKLIEIFDSKFTCVPFDVKGAAIAATLWKSNQKLKQTDRQSRKLLKADALIIASAKAAGASSFYTLDEKARKLASNIMNAPPLPSHHSNMFVDKEFE